MLGREGAAALRPKLMLLRGWRLPPPLCPLVLARCPALLEESDSQLQVGSAQRWQGQGRRRCRRAARRRVRAASHLSLIHISEPTRQP